METVDAPVVDAVAAILGDRLGVFLGFTVIMFGAAAYMTGQALAQTWRPAWQAALYALLLTVGDRFLSFALFESDLLSPSGYVIDWVILASLSVLGFRITQARLMVRQYPWLYERSGLFGWREKGA